MGFLFHVLLQVGDEYLDMEHHYKLVTKAYLGKGKDGYDSLSGADVRLIYSEHSTMNPGAGG